MDCKWAQVKWDCCSLGFWQINQSTYDTIRVAQTWGAFFPREGLWDYHVSIKKIQPEFKKEGWCTAFCACLSLCCPLNRAKHFPSWLFGHVTKPNPWATTCCNSLQYDLQISNVLLHLLLFTKSQIVAMKKIFLFNTIMHTTNRTSSGIWDLVGTTII